MANDFSGRTSTSLTSGSSKPSGDQASGESDVPAVRAWAGEITLPTYSPAAPDKNPMFLENRVYQGSSGKVYPLPFTDRVDEKARPQVWRAVWMENEFLRVLVLPEIGGRIHSILDKTNRYDVIYNQHVIKPALVGLAGPWISGGIEFNWPQHHRPATFLPVDFEIEEHEDGSKTIWCSDHDPLTRMKGMHGVCLHPGKAYVELKARAYNRTATVQTFLWWANVATRVHEAYQSFFPPDVYYVADHARRSMSEYPLARGFYYGVNYGKRGREGVLENERPSMFRPAHCAGETPVMYAPNDLSFYANIPVPTSYMCMGSQQDFFGGYDYKARAGIIHIANHHISPGKKQWTWGNHEFGYAWDRNLTDPDGQGEYGPYIEIMAGVYTDNQPDFSYLLPGETKTWSQFWYPIQQIGPAQHANLDAAIAVNESVGKPGHLTIGVAGTRDFSGAELRLRKTGAANGELARFKTDVRPGKPFTSEVPLPRNVTPHDVTVELFGADGVLIISYTPKARPQAKVPPAATEPPAPEEIDSADELYVTGQHLYQYRHATRSPVLYWQEALRRDPQDSRCNNALGLWHFRRGEFELAAKHFRTAIERLTRRNPNPYDGEPFYNLGQCLRHLGKPGEAYAALYKATWNQQWVAPASQALAEIDSARQSWSEALAQVERSLRFNTDNLVARDLRALILRKVGRSAQAEALLSETLRMDPLDWWARHIVGEKFECDLQVRLDLAHDYARAGFLEEAVTLLTQAKEEPAPCPRSLGTQPMIEYTLAWLEQKRGNFNAAKAHCSKAAAASPDYCFPARLEEIAILQNAIQLNPQDARAPYYLGNLLYDKGRHEEAVKLWERATRLDPEYSVAWRNLGIGLFNIRKQPARARAAYDRAFRANPADARLLFERDQLWKRLGETPAVRLKELERWPELVCHRDDLTVELSALYNQTSQPHRALNLLLSRNFQPWEGGEGGPLGQYVRARLALGRAALDQRDATAAREQFEAALSTPPNLGEAKHLLANQSDIHYWLGRALSELGDRKRAREHWKSAATFKGDFQEMSVRLFSEMTYYSALAWEALGSGDKARKLLNELLDFGKELQQSRAKVDYFATSLPTMLLFNDDLQARQETTALFVQAQAQLGLGRKKQAKQLLEQVLKRDPNHAAAGDLARI